MLSVIIPVYNGEAALAALWKRLKPVLSTLSCRTEVIFIDDGSTDGSLKQIRKICGGGEAAGWATFTENRGQQTAVLCGLRLCRGDWALTLDDDLQHPPEFIPELLNAAEGGGFDAVYAVPEGSSRAGGRMRDVFFSSLLGKPAGMRIGSFRIFSRAAVDQICRASGDFVYISAELFRAASPSSGASGGLRVGSVSYSRVENAGGAGAGPSRYGILRRLGLYIRLVLWYTPAFRGLTKRLASGDKSQYVIAETGGII